MTQTGLSTDHATEARQELASADRVRVGVVQAPVGSTFFVEMDRDGTPHGVTVDLGDALAQSLGLPAEFAVHRNSGELANGLETGLVDVAFMPRDEERERRLDFGPAYFLIESTGLVHDDAPFRTTSDLDRPDVRIVGIANTTTIRGTLRHLPRATIIPAVSVDEALRVFASRQADALVLSRDALSGYLAGLPGTRLLAGKIHATDIAVVVPRNRRAMLAHSSAFVTWAKDSGLVRRAFDAAGFLSEAVAPADGNELA